MTIDHSADPDDLVEEEEDEDEDVMETSAERKERRLANRIERRTPSRLTAPPPMPAAEQRVATRIEELQQINRAQESKIKNLIVQGDEDRRMLDRAQTRYMAKQREWEEVMSSKELTLGKLRDREKELVAEVDRLDMANSRLVEEAERLKAQVDQIANDRQASGMEINSMSKRMAALVRQRDTAQRENADLKTQLVEVRFQRDEARAHVKELLDSDASNAMVPREAPVEGPEMLPERLVTWLRQNAPGMPLEDPVAELERVLDGSLAMFKTAWPIIAKQVDDVLRQLGKMGWDFKQGKVPLCLGGHCTADGHTMQPYQCSQWEPKLSPGA